MCDSRYIYISQTLYRKDTRNIIYNTTGVVIAPTITFPHMRFRCFIGDISDSITKRKARNSEFNIDGLIMSILLYSRFIILRSMLIIVSVKNAVKNPIKRPLMNLKDNAVVVVVSMLRISMKNNAIVSNNAKIRTNR